MFARVANRLVVLAVLLVLTVPLRAAADADLEITGPMSAVLEIGVPMPVVYTIRNNGPMSAANVIGVVSLEALESVTVNGEECPLFVCSIATLAPGQSVTMTAMYRATGPARVEMYATVYVNGGFDPNGSNNWIYLYGYVRTIFVVNSTGDALDSFPGDGICADATGACTIRAALQEASISPAPDAVHFAIGSGSQTIALTNDSLVVLGEITIDGTTQPGYDGTPLITIDGSALSYAHGLSIMDGRATIRGLALRGFNVAVACVGGSGHAIMNNWIGPDVFNPSAGIVLSVSEVLVAENVIAGHASSAVHVSADDCIVRDNRIGTDASGMVQTGSPFGVGIRINGASRTRVLRNLVAPRGGGIFVQGATATANVIGENSIGVAADGTALPMNGIGVQLSSGRFNVVEDNVTRARMQVVNAHDNRIEGNHIGVSPGGAALGNPSSGIFLQGERNRIAENTIAFNGQQGIVAYGFGGGNAIRGNSIHDNGMLGIDLGGNGVTPNDSGDGDAGPNALQNAPVLTFAQSAGGITTVQGALDSAPNAAFVVELFVNDECDPSGYGEGHTPVGTLNVATDAAGHAEISASFAFAIGSSAVMTATATDANGNTSELSACTAVVLNRPPIAVCQDVTAIASGSCDAIVSAKDVDGGSFDPDGDALAMTLSPAGPFPTGTTSVELTVIDPSGATAMCAAKVTVIDETLPELACPADVEVRLEYGETEAAVAYDAPVVTDNCPATVASCDIPPGSMFTAGTTLVTCTATDATGNVATCTFNVTVLTAMAATERLAAAIDGLVAQGALSPGNATALSAQLDAALRSLEGGNRTAAIHQLEAFVAYVEALVRGGQLSGSDGDALIAQAHAVLAQLR
jgi:parallel beta-helix repeat protein